MWRWLHSRLRKSPSLTPDDVQTIEELERRFIQPIARLRVGKEPSQSWFKGDPMLPAGQSWPTRANGLPLSFLARVSLSQIQSVTNLPLLPSEGSLLFFYDMSDMPWGMEMKDRDGWKVLHVSDVEEHTSTPEQAVPMHIERGQSLPFSGDMSFTEDASLKRLKDAAWDIFDSHANQIAGTNPLHQIGGYAAFIQHGEMPLECQLMREQNQGKSCSREAVLAEHALQWRLLFQLDSDEGLNFCWGDSGTLYFWIRESDARAGDFSQVWMIMQCY